MKDRRTHIVMMMCFGMSFAAYVGCGGSGTTGGSGGAGGASTSSTTSSKSSSKASSGVTSGSMSTSVSTSGSGLVAGSIGFACKGDADCSAGGLKCITAIGTVPAFGGGPAGGYCSKDCTADADCGGGNSCFTDANGTNGLCVLGCTLGPALKSLADPLPKTKCYGRNDLRCTALTNITNACLPTCGSDSQCTAGGRVCDPRLNVCVDKANVSMGKPGGAKCNPKAAIPECAGTCVNFVGGVTACSNTCVLGGGANTPNCGGNSKGICAYSVMGNGAGDEGSCAPACLAQDDCQNPAFWCFGSGLPNGFCFGTDKCPKGQGDCTDPSATCTPTANGPYCLDATIPLTNADGGAPDGGDAGPGDAGDAGPGDAGDAGDADPGDAGPADAPAG